MRIFDGQPEALAGDSVFVAPLEAALRRRTELRLGTTWSWAELAPDQEDFEWLLGWAERAGGTSLQQWLERLPDIRIAAQRVEVCGQRYDRRDVAGALLSFVLAEVGRRAATEEKRCLTPFLVAVMSLLELLGVAPGTSSGAVRHLPQRGRGWRSAMPAGARRLWSCPASSSSVIRR